VNIIYVTYSSVLVAWGGRDLLGPDGVVFWTIWETCSPSDLSWSTKLSTSLDLLPSFIALLLALALLFSIRKVSLSEM
jgi:hypothetical protein